MASIERTAYPRLKKKFTQTELQNYYTPTLEEIFFVRENSRNEEPQLHLLLCLKLFQKLNYFPNLETVPENLIVHLRKSLKFSREILPTVTPRTQYKHHQIVRDYFAVKTYNQTARKLIRSAVYQAAQTMDNPADLINVAIEKLIKERYELPAYSTLDRLARHLRIWVNRGFWQTILNDLESSQITRLDNLLLPDPQAFRTPYNSLKQLPKKPTLGHLRELLEHLDWLLGLGNFVQVLENIPPLKIKHFAGEANALDAGEIKKFNEPKRIAFWFV